MKKQILPIWQPVGKSTNHLTRQIADKIGLKTAHTGTLDPMAEGVVVVLAGNKRLEKIKLASWKKTYEFDIAFGISTDSFDGLGLITKTNFECKTISPKVIQSVLKSLVGNYSQTVPLYSAIKVAGRKLHQHAKYGNFKVILPHKKGEIFKLKLIELKTVSVKKLVKNLIAKIKLVEGDLRQKEITDCWENFTGNIDTTSIQVAKIEVQISRGMYVRSLSQDICEKLGINGFVSNLIRTRNGKYSKKSCIIPYNN
ncbi:hypothetical protein A3K34_03785 [candidate division WWE3 bacterium RIFOXYC1_FULL_40_10]|uniref:tRNA pseudouridine(55) synthase n=1 Tax=candidate division WWE3 bacterium RIFOXYA2_FULL_46_9 TaxID=1802636 RepID=A0A1F4W0W0_UNCKA|nr:MAG: hypothetical protein A3K58_03785 [candidate division WWE3 bacterium RIFOXYB1_FULL_40_22]OGC61962.1 MAG: hypothetical protein A3K37_03785 [candidate division WWE3 bacterium RIFOXYA1_FULL_40_11]OGC63054.1 MAG: hypothetical protein A2264_03900 [candidate division WWE3 bacterium RIFOXYA2_FULL_46_9]OGC64519.1 MAG: hypothetical protein A2326_03925 [candidate division WWE3 bacterium RIFOXYB2_FULL_41_6]OGC66345.1 MAG: hypothetical protein A3K34_03785 [candidate division WWE3 bacterium RIFOXYC1_